MDCVLVIEHALSLLPSPPPSLPLSFSLSLNRHDGLHPWDFVRLLLFIITGPLPKLHGGGGRRGGTCATSRALCGRVGPPHTNVRAAWANCERGLSAALLQLLHVNTCSVFSAPLIGLRSNTHSPREFIFGLSPQGGNLPMSPHSHTPNITQAPGKQPHSVPDLPLYLAHSLGELLPISSFLMKPSLL